MRKIEGNECLLYKDDKREPWVPIIINTIQRNSTMEDLPHQLPWWKTVDYTHRFQRDKYNPAYVVPWISLCSSAQISISLSYFERKKEKKKKKAFFP